VLTPAQMARLRDTAALVLNTNKRIRINYQAL
jgi:hypothetical protein